MKKCIKLFVLTFILVYVFTFKPYSFKYHLSLETYQNGFIIYTHMENFTINPKYNGTDVKSLGGGLWVYEYSDDESFDQNLLKMNFSLTPYQIWYHLRDHTYLDSFKKFDIYSFHEVTIQDKLIQFGIKFDY